ncbi:hypothetical protein [Dietzia sp. B32]|uniref:hypothetical protein n=1 Tax=Dietzia sp. B32 TaxID=2915130 RepID=UPI0021AD791C|nr:hypothetical protein [Dietzia sp. B32]UVE96362.1 hypothetical protein L8M95_06220 [Dietzia sp. B32]
MVGFRRSKHRIRHGAGDAALAPDASPPAHDAPAPGPHTGFGWAVLGVAALLGVVFLVPSGLEESSAVVPTTSSDRASLTSGPQTWVLSSTVASPGPAAGESDSLIIRVPAGSPTSGPGTDAPTIARQPADPSPTAAAPSTSAPAPAPVPAPSTTVPASEATCPQPTVTGVAPRLVDRLGGELGSTSGTGDEAGGHCAG